MLNKTGLSIRKQLFAGSRRLFQCVIKIVSVDNYSRENHSSSSVSLIWRHGNRLALDPLSGASFLLMRLLFTSYSLLLPRLLPSDEGEIEGCGVYLAQDSKKSNNNPPAQKQHGKATFLLT